MTTCDSVQPRLSEFIDRQLDHDQASEVRAHLASCAQCRTLADDLDRVRSAARSLGPVQPPAHIWLEIAGRIRLEGVAPRPIAQPATTEAPRAAEGTWQWLGLAAALTLVTLGVYSVTRPDPSAPSVVAGASAGNASETPTVETVDEAMKRAEAEYEIAIKKLEQLVNAGDPSVSPTTAATLQKNLITIDSAIAETRAALSENPESQPARVSLFEALKNKVNLLQHSVVLMNEMWRGDAGGAAETAAEISGSGRGTS
jgi:hypothetical protein